jgi:hypothetical protein
MEAQEDEVKSAYHPAIYSCLIARRILGGAGASAALAFLDDASASPASRRPERNLLHFHHGLPGLHSSAVV